MAREGLFVLEPKIRVDRALLQRLARIAGRAGYSSTEEYVRHLLEKAVADAEATDPDAAESEEDVRKRLQGLGYID